MTDETRGNTPDLLLPSDATIPSDSQPEAPATGYGTEHKPTWDSGLLLLNYNPQTITPEMLEELVIRVQHPGHPLWQQGIGTEIESWGELKAQYKR